jgi:HEPN domain-containing protein
MPNESLARSYLVKSRKRMKALETLMNEEAWSDVVREAQEIVELALKVILRHLGVEPPRWHDVSGTVLEYRDRLPAPIHPHLERIVEISEECCARE